MTMSKQLGQGDIIPVLDPFKIVNAKLLELVDGLGADDWNKPTVHQDRSVKDLVTHLLHGSLRRVTGIRDAYRPTSVPISSTEELVEFIQADNRDFILGMRRISPPIIIELLRIYDPKCYELMSTFETMEDGLGVVWAGETVSRRWFDLAREYTEKWHHQQQVRDAVGAEGLYDDHLFRPVLDTFARGLPFALRQVPGKSGHTVDVQVTGMLDAGWTLLHDGTVWSLWSRSAEPAPECISLPAEIAWKLWTKSVSPDQARGAATGDFSSATLQAVLSFVAIMK